MRSPSFSGKFQNSGMAVSRGEFLTLNSSEWPSDAAVSFLSDALETGGVPQRYSLSPKACAGILRRAEKRGKPLPEPLGEVLTAIRTANTSANGIGITEECAHTIDCAQPEAVAFAQNTRNEVRLQGGDGSVTGPIAASDSAKGQGVPFVMATGQANAEVTQDMTPTLNCAHEQPLICMADDNAKAAIDKDVCGTLKVGGAPPLVAAVTDKT